MTNTEAESIIVEVVGAGFVEQENGVSTFSVIEREYKFKDPIEFGRFLGPGYILTSVDLKESDIDVPQSAVPTWSVRHIQNGSADLFINWAEEFSEHTINQKNLTISEILIYWLERTGDSTIREAVFAHMDDL